MDSFEDWLTKTVDHSCVQRWSDRLLDLGASWDTFRRNSNDVVDDLVGGGIPLLAARDICKLASEAVARRAAPLAIFWDLENMPIPSSISGREVAARLKSVVAPHGDLVQFRAYANIGLGLIPQQKRSDLQLSNCHLVDCPHQGRKEVADKMIIVDAMQFAFTHPEGATLCFVTGDVDYAHLLAVLQRPQWKTIVISKGTMQSMLDVNCDMKMRWESDVLQLRSSLPSAPPGFHGAAKVSGALNTLSLFVTSSEGLDESQASTSHDLTHRIIQNDGTSETLSVEALTIIKERTDDAELLRTIVREAPQAPTYAGSLAEGHHVARKSHVGNTLRQMNSARFPDRQAVKDFLARAVETGIVIESGEGAFKTFRLPSDEQAGAFRPPFGLSESAPVAAQDLPLRAQEMIITLPFILFAPWELCPKEDQFPAKTFVQSSGKWAVLMFPTLTTAQHAVAEKPWLRSGTLVDWRRVAHFKDPTLTDADKAMEIIACTLCKSQCRKSLMKALDSGDLFCQSCWSLVEARSDSDKIDAT